MGVGSARAPVINLDEKVLRVIFPRQVILVNHTTVRRVTLKKMKGISDSRHDPFVKPPDNYEKVNLNI